MTEGGDGPPSFFVKHVIDEQRRGGFLKIGDDHGPDGVAEVLHFFLEDGAQRLAFGVAVGKDAVDGGGALLFTVFCDLHAEQAVVLGGSLGFGLVVGVA